MQKMTFTVTVNAPLGYNRERMLKYIEEAVQLYRKGLSPKELLFDMPESSFVIRDPSERKRRGPKTSQSLETPQEDATLQ